MTRDVFTATVKTAPPSGGAGKTVSVGRAQEPNTAVAALAAAIAAAVALQASTTAVAADVATLVADGASPTQAHVTQLNTDWETFLTAYTAYAAAVSALSTTATAGSVSADVTLLYNVATVIDKNTLRNALRAIEKQAVNKSSPLSGD